MRKDKTIILVIGATGTVGSEVTRELVASGQQVRAFVRDAVTARRKLGEGVEFALGDLAHPSTLDNALRDVESVYLVLPLAPELRQWDAQVIDAAKRAGVRHVVKHSNLGASDSGMTLQRWHREGERVLEDSGMAWTFVRPTGFMSNALGWAGMIKEAGAVYAPGGDGKLSLVDPRDIAAVAVAALTEVGHEGKAYEVTGPQALSTEDQVRIIAEAIGKPVQYVGIPNDAARTEMRKTGMPDVSIDALLEFMDLVRDGKAAQVSDAVLKVTGRPARTFQAWVSENLSAFE